MHLRWWRLALIVALQGGSAFALHPEWGHPIKCPFGVTNLFVDGPESPLAVDTDELGAEALRAAFGNQQAIPGGCHSRGS
jgi:hypothetical protein